MSRSQTRVVLFLVGQPVVIRGDRKSKKGPKYHDFLNLKHRKTMKLSVRLLGCANSRFQVYLIMNLNTCVSLSSRIGTVASRLTGLGSRIRDAVSRCMEAISRYRNAASRKKITPPVFCWISPVVAAPSPGKQTHLRHRQRYILERNHKSRLRNAISRKSIAPPVSGALYPAKKSYLLGQQQYLPGRCHVFAFFC